MDNRRDLQALFSDAPGEAPPPGFSLDDVTAASRRATARHRLRVATASSAAALVLLGGGIFVALGPLSGDGGGSGEEAALSAPQFDGQPGAGDARQESGGSERAPAPSKQGDVAEGPGVARTERCTQVDRRLATALAGELPVVPSSEPVPADFPCHEGVRVAAYEVDGQVISAAFIPEDRRKSVNPHDDPNAKLKSSRDPNYVWTVTDDGDLVVVIRRDSSDGAVEESAGDDLQKVANGIADELG